MFSPHLLSCNAPACQQGKGQAISGRNRCMMGVRGSDRINSNGRRWLWAIEVHGTGLWQGPPRSTHWRPL